MLHGIHNFQCAVVLSADLPQSMCAAKLGKLSAWAQGRRRKMSASEGGENATGMNAFEACRGSKSEELEE